MPKNDTVMIPFQSLCQYPQPAHCKSLPVQRQLPLIHNPYQELACLPSAATWRIDSVRDVQGPSQACLLEKVVQSAIIWNKA